MISNITRYFLVGLVVAVCVATADNTYAFKLGSLQDGGMSRFDIGSTYGKVCIQNDSFYQGYGSLIKQGYVFGSYGGSNTCIDSVMGANSIFQAIHTNPIGDASTHGYFYTSLVSFQIDNQGGYDFKYYDINSNSLQTFNVPSIAGFTYTMSYGENAFFDEVYFWHDSIIFMDSTNHYTLQLLGTTLLENIVVYVDPFSVGDNIYMIDFNLGKARSTELSEEYVTNIMFNIVDVTNNLLFREINWTTSYSLSAGTTSFWPSTAGNLCSGDGCRQANGGYSSSMWSYNTDLSFVAPDYSNQFPGGNPLLSGSISQQDSIEEYNSCIDRYINVKDLSSFWFQCRSDYENNKLTRSQYLDIENYVLDLSSNTAFTGETVTDNCFLMSDIALNMFDTHSGTYNVDVNLAWRGSSSTNGIDLTYMCGSRPSQSTSSDGVSWWQDLLNQIGIGNSEEGSGSSVLDITIDSFKNLVSSPINEYVIDPISEEYYSGYNLLSNSACISTNNSFPYGDYLLYFAAAILSVVLFGIFF